MWASLLKDAYMKSNCAGHPFHWLAQEDINPTHVTCLGLDAGTEQDSSAEPLPQSVLATLLHVDLQEEWIVDLARGEGTG